MLENEFKSIWDAQALHYPDLLTEMLRYGRVGKCDYPCKPRKKCNGSSDLQSFGLHGAIFFQRKMYWPNSVVGLCELEPKEKRCPRSDRRAQRFRLLQEINNLRYIDPDAHEECKLSAQQRELLIEYLSTREKATFDDIRKKLGFLESVKFNLERGKRPKKAWAST
jgi:CRISPR-associated endonuclease Csn1